MNTLKFRTTLLDDRMILLCTGAFLIPYFLMLFALAMPLHLLESGVGQFGGVGITLSFGRSVPIAKVKCPFFLSRKN